MCSPRKKSPWAYSEADLPKFQKFVAATTSDFENLQDLLPRKELVGTVKQSLFVSETEAARNAKAHMLNHDHILCPLKVSDCAPKDGCTLGCAKAACLRGLLLRSYFVYDMTGPCMPSYNAHCLPFVPVPPVYRLSPASTAYFHSFALSSRPMKGCGETLEFQIFPTPSEYPFSNGNILHRDGKLYPAYLVCPSKACSYRCTSWTAAKHLLAIVSPPQ